MFWSDWGHPARIARAYMDGSSDHSFISDGIHWPNGLAIDYPNQRLYWTDGKALTLESVNLDGTDRRVSRKLSDFSFCMDKKVTTTSDQISS